MRIEDMIQSLINSGDITQDEINRAMDEQRERLKNKEFNYDGLELEQAYQLKLKELSYQCQKAILGYFEADVNGTIYKFSFDTEAQRNFTGALALFTNGSITEIKWTAWLDDVPQRLTLTEAQFLPIIGTAFAHKDSKIDRFRDVLQPQVDEAYANGDIEAIKAITWETNIV